MKSAGKGRHGIVCPDTGLRLVEARRITTYRVQRTDYPNLSAPVRGPGSDRTKWNRFDTVGRTLYLAETAECAFAETLSPFKRVIGTVDPLEKDARALGMTLEEFYEAVAKDWEERSFMNTGALPRIWRDRREIRTVSLPFPGWWVHIEHPDSIAALARGLSEELGSLGVGDLDTAVLRSKDRAVTTAIAEHLRGLTLFDGSEALGIVYGSRHGAYSNWAVWLRRQDQGLDPEGEDGSDGLRSLTASPVHFNDPDLEAASGRFQIKVF